MLYMNTVMKFVGKKVLVFALIIFALKIIPLSVPIATVKLSTRSMVTRDMPPRKNATIRTMHIEGHLFEHCIQRELPSERLKPV